MSASRNASNHFANMGMRKNGNWHEKAEIMLTRRMGLIKHSLVKSVKDVETT